MQGKRLKPTDLDLELPTSLREIVVDELHAQNLDGLPEGRPVQLIDDRLIEETLQRVYAHVERQALATYHSNEPWALKQWCLSNILTHEIINDTSIAIATELITPVMEWQKQDFNPIAYYRETLELEQKKRRTVECYMLTAARFVGMLGRRRYGIQYSQEDIRRYLAWANKRLNQCSYCQECTRLLQFLRRLPGADPNMKLPIQMPRMPDEFYQPTFTEDEVETLVWSSVIDNIPFNMVVRLIVASVYGARRTELAQLSSDDIYLDGNKSTVFIRTGKRGQRKPQPIPESLVPLFSVPITPMHDHTLQRQLKKICKRAGVKLPFRGGFHCFRRRTVTTVAGIEPSEINTYNFMRWATPRSLGMLARYKQTPVEQGDIAILEKHPFVKMWEEVKPYLLELNSSYPSKPALLHIA